MTKRRRAKLLALTERHTRGGFVIGSAEGRVGDLTAARALALETYIRVATKSQPDA